MTKIITTAKKEKAAICEIFLHVADDFDGIDRGKFV